MSMNGVFVAIDRRKSEYLLEHTGEIEAFFQGNLADKPAAVLDIGDAWDSVRVVFDEVGGALSNVVGLDIVEGTECNICMSVPPEAVAAIARRFESLKPSELADVLASIDYEPIYHGEHWQADSQGLLVIIKKIADFYINAANRNDAVVFYVP